MSPGIRLLGRFGFARKFQLLFLLFMLPLVGSLWMIGLDYRDKLALIAGERAGVSQLLALETLDDLLTAQRDRTARWKAADILHDPTPAARDAMGALDAANPGIGQALTLIGAELHRDGATSETLDRYQKLQSAATGLDSAALRTVGWWPDGYERFTTALRDRKSTRLNSSH